MFPDETLDFVVEAAFGADPAGDPDTWSWTDLTSRLTGTVTMRRGKAPGAEQVSAASLTVNLFDDDGALTPNNPSSTYFPFVRRNVPMRFTAESVVVLTGFAASYRASLVPQTDGTLRSVMVIEVAGVLRGLEQGAQNLRAAPRQYIPSTGPLAYWSLEDGQLAAYGTPDVGRNRMTSWTGKHPSGAVATFAKWGTGSLGPWLPNVFSFPASSDLAIIAGRVDMPGSPPTWTVDFMYAGTGSDGVALDINPSYLTDNPTGWPQLTLDAVNRLLLVTFNGEPETSSSTPGLFDGLGHHIRLTARQAGGNVAWTAYIDGIEAQTDTTSGILTLAPIEALALVGDQASSDAVGHLAVWTNPPSVLAAAAAALGYPGEPAGRRIERLCDEQSVPLRIVDEYRILDTFNRTVANNLGTTDTGEAWTLSGGSAADFDVAAGEATITQGSTTVVRAGVVGAAVDAFDVRVLVEVPAASTGGSVGIQAGLVYRWISDTDHYRAQITFAPTGSADFGLARAGGAGVSLGTTVGLGSYTAGDRFWVRVRGRDALFYARAWRESQAQPSTWAVARDDDELTAGKVGFFARRGVGDTTATPTYTFSQFSADSALDDTEPMGPQSDGTLPDLLREAEAVDMGILFESRDAFGLAYRTRVDGYNQPAALTIDLSTYETAKGTSGGVLAPVYDEQQLVNDIDVSRTFGSSAHYTNDESVVADGRHSRNIELNASSDDQLPDLAAWLGHLGTADDTRFPAMPIDLAANPGLIADWLVCDIGHRVLRTNQPAPQPADDIDQIIDGYSQTFGPLSWTADANVSPASPHTVGIWEDTVLGRADTDGTVTTASFVAGTDTSLKVAVTAGNAWVTTASNPSEFPFDIRAGGAVLAVTGIGAATVLNSNPFFETNTSGWSVNPGEGAITRSTAQFHQGAASGLLTPDGVGTQAVARSVAATGISPGQVLTGSAWLRCAAARSVNFRIDWRNSGGTFLSGDTVTIAVAANTWTFFEITATAPASTAQAGITAQMTGTPLVSHLLYIDEAQLYPTGGQTMTVTQTAVNGVARTIPAGTDVRLAHPMIAGL